MWVLAGQGGQCPYSSVDGLAGGRDGNPSGGGGDAPAGGAGLEQTTDLDGAGHLASYGQPSQLLPQEPQQRARGHSKDG